MEPDSARRMDADGAARDVRELPRGSRCEAARATTGQLLAVLPLIIAAAFFLIADIDAPRGGVIRVAPKNLHALVDSLK